MLGVWLFAVYGIAVPEFIKMGHAHAAWWSILILLMALLIPGTPFRPKVRKFISFTAITAVPAWTVALAAYYISKEARGIGTPLPSQPGAEFSLEYAVYGTGLFLLEVWFFAVLALVFLADARQDRFDPISGKSRSLNWLAPQLLLLLQADPISMKFLAHKESHRGQGEREWQSAYHSQQLQELLQGRCIRSLVLITCRRWLRLL